MQSLHASQVNIYNVIVYCLELHVLLKVDLSMHLSDCIMIS